jgi:hypothetical protein
MSELQLNIDGDRQGFTPGGSLAGHASWDVSGVTTAEVRLFWYTKGKGTQDVQIVDTVVFESPQNRDRREFRMGLPDQPYSVSGKLISIVWALELLVERGAHVERREFVLSPTGREIQIT